MTSTATTPITWSNKTQCQQASAATSFHEMMEEKTQQIQSIKGLLRRNMCGDEQINE
jgi:hypothetical protein